MDSYFRIPLTFPTASELPSPESQSFLGKSLNKSTPNWIRSWGDATSIPEGSGAVVGCQDGTLYIFKPSIGLDEKPTPSRLPEIIEPLRLKNLTRPSKPRSRTHSHPTSPNSMSFPLSPVFNVTARPRVVSGVTMEPVEAPKNYVDFEDEPEKLKDILKGKIPRDRHSISETSGERTPKSTASSIIEPVPALKRKNTPRSLFSSNDSRAPTPSFLDTSDSSAVSHSWTLQSHIIPSRSGKGYSVKAIQVLEDGQFLATLHESGDLYVFSSDDGTSVASVNASDQLLSTQDLLLTRDRWEWSTLIATSVDGCKILVATAAIDTSASAVPSLEADEGSSDNFQCSVFELNFTPSEVQLIPIGHWEFNGPAKGLGVHPESNGTSSLFFVNNQGHFIAHEIKLRPPFLPIPPATTRLTPPTNGSEDDHHHSTLLLPNPFKAIMSRSTEHLPQNENKNSTPQSDMRISLLEPHDVGPLPIGPALSGLVTCTYGDGQRRGIAWSHTELAVFDFDGRSLKVHSHLPVEGLKDARWLDCNSFGLTFGDRVDIYNLKLLNADGEVGDLQSASAGLLQFRPEFHSTISVGRHDTITIYGPRHLLASRVVETRKQQLVLFDIDRQGTQGVDEPVCVLWHSGNAAKSSPSIALTSSLPLESDIVIQGYSDGCLRQFTFAQLSRRYDDPRLSISSAMKTSTPPLNGYLMGLHVVQNPRTKEKYILGGADDGSIAFWSLTTYEVAARWIIFITPLSRVLQFQDEKSSPLGGCVLCISRDGTIAIIAVDGFHFLCLVPGSSSPLKRICLGGHNLLLIYADRRARLWDAQTRELWRSMSLDKAEELLAQGGWANLSLEKDASVPRTIWSPISDALDGYDAAATLSLNIERFILNSIAVTKTISTSIDEVRGILLTLERLRFILSILITPGLSDDVDSICFGKLKVHLSSSFVGFSSHRVSTLYQTNHPRDIWCISPNVSTARALAIVAVLKAMSLFEDLTDGANTVITFYSTALPVCVGPRYKAFSLEYLGRRWFEASVEFRQSIRILFDAAVANLSDESAIQVTEKWQHYVPSLQPDAEKESTNAALALFICGCVAAEKYSLLSTNALTDISKSITLYLHDEKSSYRVLAIDLCSRGFHVWQHYIDAMEILRSLFNLATSVRKDSISVQNVGAQARSAVLSIASSNTPLFMGTLCLDILTPPSMDHRRSVLQILAFLTRKRPFVLQPNLPRLMEAVVKSLDPNSTADRDLVLDSATEIIGYVVKTFPSVDFHMATQRLAVGTNEGAVVMYDLKIAIRLYVLEGHKRQLSACSFSPDGRRLVTISLQESSVLVWKVGSSFASFFNPGAPPRQGHGGSQPFKTLNFNIGAEANMTTEETLQFVRVEWIADRSVKVKIRESVLTFST